MPNIVSDAEQQAAGQNSSAKRTVMGDLQMPDHQFVYTVSGIDLSDVQKSRISEQIAAVVTRAITGDVPDRLSANYLTLVRIHGGKWIQADTDVNLEGLKTPTQV